MFTSCRNFDLQCNDENNITQRKHQPQMGQPISRHWSLFITPEKTRGFMFSGGTDTGHHNLTKYWHDTLNCVRCQPLKVTARSALLRNEMPCSLLKTANALPFKGMQFSKCPIFRKRVKNYQLCPFTALSCPFLAIPYA